VPHVCALYMVPRVHSAHGRWWWVRSFSEEKSPVHTEEDYCCVWWWVRFFSEEKSPVHTEEDYCCVWWWVQTPRAMRLMYVDRQHATTWLLIHHTSYVDMMNVSLVLRAALYQPTVSFSQHR
jgi:hypothetical protein